MMNAQSEQDRGATSAATMAITAELLALLADSLDGDRPVAPVFALLAREVCDLSEVRGAFEMSTLAPEDLPATPEFR